MLSKMFGDVFFKCIINQPTIVTNNNNNIQHKKMQMNYDSNMSGQESLLG